ncbi:MAG: ABC transporter ATP-binding protein/permease [archaeon]|nr:ABC transporter ATP-binding protein/permease [archaeon]
MKGHVPSITGNLRVKGVEKERPASMVRSWRLIIGYLGNHAYIVLVSLFFVFLESLFAVFAPDYISDMTDLISDGLPLGDIDLDKVTMLGFMILALYTFSALAMFVRNYLMANLAQYMAGEMRRDLSRKLSRLPMRFFDDSRNGDIMSRFTNDADTVGSALNRSLSVFFHGVFLLILCTVMMLLTNVPLALVSISSALIGMVLSVVIVKSTQKYYRNQQNNIGRMYNLINEMYTSHDLVLSYSGQDLNRRKFDSLNESLRMSGFRSEITMGLLPAIMAFVGNAGYVAVCIIGSVMVLDGDITIGTVVAFIIYVKMFMGPLDMISNSLGNLQAAGAGAERIFDFLSMKELPEEDPVPPAVVKGRVEFENVCFGYREDRQTIKGFTATVEPGRKVAIVGSTGAGKTTVVNLLMRFYDYQEGDIRIDGVSLKDIPRRNIGKMFCMVTQDSWIFEGTVRENLVYSSDISDDRIRGACVKVGLDRFVDSLPQGLDTPIGKRNSLSEGQKQQICIARAILDDSPMLILDEATSSVDTRTEMTIQKAIDSLMEGRTTFVIAHRLSTVRNADLILVMKDGDIVECGTHKELLSKNGTYTELYMSQFDI